MQVVEYEPSAADPPALRVAIDGSLSTIELVPGRILDFSLEKRHCAGVIDGDQHSPCDRAKAPYCEFHRSEWPCARCTGNCAMPLEACHEEHVVYLAAFAPSIFKVGVTRTWRLERRLEEQGADRAVRIRTVPNGRKARSIEADLATDLTDRVTVASKIYGLHRSVDVDSWESLLKGFQVEASFDFSYGFDLDRQPVAETLLRGEVIGTKGRILVLERDGTTYAVDMRDLLGYELTRSKLHSERQSSLVAFE